MKCIKPSYEILTDISPYGTLELEEIERAARVCYKSEDKYEDQGESAKKLIRKLIGNGHEAMLEHSSLSVKFICDRGVSHELVRHRMASFAQESTRYCNYSKDKFGHEITVIIPPWINEKYLPKDDEAVELTKMLLLGPNTEAAKYRLNRMSTEERVALIWWASCFEDEAGYFVMLDEGFTPQQARCILPNSLKTEIVVTANYREWRHILKLRTDPSAHPQMRELMVPLLNELTDRIGVIFDDIKENRRD